MFLLKPSLLTESDWKFSDAPRDDPVLASPSHWEQRGDIMKVESHGFDYAVWKLGGAAVYLRLVQLSSVSLRLARVSHQ